MSDLAEKYGGDGWARAENMRTDADEGCILPCYNGVALGLPRGKASALGAVDFAHPMRAR